MIFPIKQRHISTLKIENSILKNAIESLLNRIVQQEEEGEAGGGGGGGGGRGGERGKGLAVEAAEEAVEEENRRARRRQSMRRMVPLHLPSASCSPDVDPAQSPTAPHPPGEQQQQQQQQYNNPDLTDVCHFYLVDNDLLKPDDTYTQFNTLAFIIHLAVST